MKQTSVKKKLKYLIILKIDWLHLQEIERILNKKEKKRKVILCNINIFRH